MAQAFTMSGGLLLPARTHSSSNSSSSARTHHSCVPSVPAACGRHAVSSNRRLIRLASKLDVSPAEDSSIATPAVCSAAAVKLNLHGPSSASLNGSTPTNGAAKASSTAHAVQAGQSNTTGLVQAGAASSMAGYDSGSNNGTADSYPAWYAAVGLSALAALICSIDRAAISVAILPMSEQYGWSDTTKGAINSAFYVGFTLTNLVGGYLASSVGTKHVLGWGVVLWSIFTITTPAAAGSTLPVLLGNRAMMGAGEGVTYPCVQNVVKFWCPADVRTRALVLIYSAGSVGTITALLTAPLIIKSLGWPAVFEVYGSLGLLWMLAWQKLVSNTPPQQVQQQQQTQQQQQQQQWNAKQLDAGGSETQQQGMPGLAAQQQQAQVSPVAQQQQQAQQQAQQHVGSVSGLPRLRDIPWKTFFTNRAFLAIIMAHAAFGVGHYVCLSWLPTYYNQEFGVDIQQSALLSVLPWLVTVLVSNTSGWIADGLANSGTLSMTHTRKLLQAIGGVGPALCLLYLATAHDEPGQLTMGEALACLTATLSLGGFQSAGFASNHQDISSKYAAVLFGITNALSSLMGTCSVYATGLILDATHSWSLVFELVAVCYLAGTAAFVALASAEQQFE